MPIQLWPHQLEALDRLADGNILIGAVGSGKSRVALAYYYMWVCEGGLSINGVGEDAKMLSPRDLYIITTAKKRDSLEWEGDASEMGLSTSRKLSWNDVQVTVDSWNNIAKYKDVENGFFILDEQRLVGNGSWVQSFLKIAAKNRWVLLSATPGDTWMDYVPVFVANGFYKNRSDFVEHHVIWKPFSKFPQIDRYIGSGKLEMLRRRISVAMPVERHTVRHEELVDVVYDRVAMDLILKKRWNIFKEKPLRNKAEMIIAARRMVNVDPSRLEVVRELINQHPKLIIFYNFNDELDILKTLEGDVDIAEWNGHKHEPIPNSDRWVYLVQYTSGSEGWNCVETNAMVFYSLSYSYRVMEQARGRIDRMNTPFTDLYYYTLRSNSRIDASIMKALRAKRNFNKRDFKVPEFDLVSQDLHAL